MAILGGHDTVSITNPVDGVLHVVACSPFPDVGGETVLHPKCDIDGVVAADRVTPTAVRYSGYKVPKLKWPRPGVILPITLDLADPHRFIIQWDQVPTAQEAAERLANEMRARAIGEQRTDKARHRTFPLIWREKTYAASSPALVNGLTPQQAEAALSGAASAIGLVPTSAKVVATHAVVPSSAPGGTWDIAVRVTDPNGGPAWEAVTRMSFSSPERFRKRTAPDYVLPVLVDPDNRARIIVDVRRLL